MSVAEQLARQKARLSSRSRPGTRVIAYYQSFTNTHAPVGRLAPIFEPALNDPEVAALAVGTRPDCLPPAVFDLLERINRVKPVWLELGLQTADDETLARINRGHTAAAFAAAAHEAARRGLLVCAHVIIGLPGEGPAHWARTARFLAGLPVGMVKVHALYVARDTALAEWLAEGRFSPPGREEFVAGAVDFLRRLRPGVVVARLTGDPASGELVAPAWAVDKSGTLVAICTAMAAGGFVQGDLHEL